MAKDFMDTQTGGTSNYETNPDVKSETKTVLPTSAAASSIQKANTEPQPQPIPDLAVSQEGKEVKGVEQESAMAPMMQTEPPADLPVPNQEQIINIDPNIQGLEEIAKEEGIELFIDEEDRVLDTPIVTPKDPTVEINETMSGAQIFTTPSEDNPVSIEDVDEESNLMPVNDFGQPIITDDTLMKEEAKAFNEENKDKGVEIKNDGGLLFPQTVDSPFDFFNTIESMEGIDPEQGKTPGYYEMPGARRGRYLKDSEGDWFKIYTNPKNGKRVKRKMGGRRALSLEDNSQLIAPVDSKFDGLWELDNYQFFKGKRDYSNFVMSQDLPEVGIQRYRNFNYTPDKVGELKSRLSTVRKHKDVDLDNPKELASILKPDWEYRYGGKKYMKSNGKWFFLNKNGVKKEVKFDIPSIEAHSRPVSSLGSLSSEYLKNRFNASMDFIKDKAQDFQNSFSEAISSGVEAVFDFAAWGASRDGKTVSDILKNTFDDPKNFGIEGYDGMTSKELMRAQMEVIDHFGIIASTELDGYAKDFSLSIDSYFSDNPYEREGYFQSIQPGLMDRDFSPKSKSGETQELGFNPYRAMANTKEGRDKIRALGYLSRHNGFQEPKTSGVYSLGDFSATKDSDNNWTDSNGNPIADIKTISALESAGAPLSEENIINSLKGFSGVSFGGEYVRNEEGKLEFKGGKDVDLSRDTDLGKMINADKRLRDFVTSKGYMHTTAISNFISQDNGGNSAGTTKSMGANALISVSQTAELAKNLSRAVSEYNAFLSSEEKLINFSSRDFKDKTQPFSPEQVKMLEETQNEAAKLLKRKSSDSEYFAKVNEVYDSAKNTIQNIYNANKKLEEIDSSGQTVDGYMLNSKKTVMSTMQNIGESEQIEEALELWNLNNSMASLITSAEQEGKLDISKDGNITFTDRVSEEEKNYLNQKLATYQEAIDEYKQQSASKNLERISQIEANLKNIPVAAERLLNRLERLDPESQEFNKTAIALAILERLENKNKAKKEGIKRTTDAVLKTKNEKLVQESSSYEWMKQHLSSIPTGEQFSGKNKFDFLFESMNARRLELESQINTTAAGLSYDKIKDMLSITPDLTDVEKEYYQTVLTVRSLAPLYANNNYGVDQDQGFGEKLFTSLVGSYYKFWFPNTYVKGSPLLTDLTSEREYAREISSFMDEAGIPTEDYSDERKKLALEKFGNKELGLEDPEFYGDQLGNGLAFVSAMQLTFFGIGTAYKGVNALTKIGRGAESLGLAEVVVDRVSTVYKGVMSSNPVTKFAMFPLDFATKFKVGGLPYNKEIQEKMNFESGLLGGIFASGLIGAGSYLSTALGKSQYLQSVFGNKYGQVVKLLVDKSKGVRETFGGESTKTMFGLGMGETTKEVREQLTLAWQSSDKGKAVWDVIEKNYGTYDQRMKFVVSSIIMGAFFHMGANLGKAKRAYDTLSPDMKRKVDLIKADIEKTSKDAIEASEKVMKEEVDRHAGVKAIDKAEQERKSKKDDSKDKEGLPSEERKGEEPVKEKPVEETSKEETSADRVLQEEQGEKSLYRKQNDSAEVTISDKKLWGQATRIREKIENAGDIFREIALGGKDASYRYIQEKIDKLQNFKKELSSSPVSKIPSEIKTIEEYNEWQSKTGNYDAVDGFEYIQKFHKDPLNTIRKEYESLRTDLKTPEQQLALDTVLNVIDGNMKGLTENLIDLNRLSRKLKEKPVEPKAKTEVKAEAKEEAKAEEKTVVPEEVDSERLSLKINETKSQDAKRDVYDIYDEVGNNIGEMTTGMEANGDIVVEKISINEGSQKQGYAKEAIEALNDAVDSTVMVEPTDANTKVVGESLAKQDNANLNESGMVELETNKPPVENTEGMSRAQKAANAVRQLKINFDTGGQTFGSMLPFDQAWNFAIESAAKIIEAGGTAAKAYSRAVNSYKNSKFYKSLKTKSEKDAEMAKFEEALIQEVGDKGLKETEQKLEENFEKVKKKAKEGDYYQGLRKKDGKPDSVRRRKFLEDLREDFEAKVAAKASSKMTSEQKKAIDKAREASTKEGRFQSQYDSAVSEAVESLKGKSIKQIELSAARARIRASEKYQKLLKQDKIQTPESIEAIKERAKKDPAYEYMSPAEQAKYLERLEQKANKKREGIETNAAEKYLNEMTKKAARKIGTRADYASKFMEDAVAKSEEKYKESEFYKEATPEKQKQMLEDFRSNARRLIEEKVESSMDAEATKELTKKLKEIDPEVVKKSPVDKGRGQRAMEQAGRKSKIEYKISLKQMLADKAKFTKEGAKYMQSVKDSVTEYARLNMPKGKYSNTELSYVLNRVKKAKKLEDVSKAFEEIDALIDKKIGQKLTSLRKETKKKYTGRGLDKQFYKTDKNGNKVYKIKDLKTRKEIMDFVKENVTESAIENMELAELEELNTTIADMIKKGRADSIAKEKVVENARRRQKAAMIEAAPESFKNKDANITDMESLYEHMQIKDSYFIADGQFYNKTAFEVVNRDALSEFKKTEEYKNLETNEAKKEAERDFLIDNPSFDFNSSNIDAYRPFSQRFRGSKRAVASLRERNAAVKARELAMGRGKMLYFDNMDLGGQMMYMARGNKAMLEFIEARVKDPIQRAGVRYEKETGEVGEAHEKALSEIFGDTLIDVANKYIGKIVYGKVPKTAQRLKDTPVDLRENGDPNGEIIVDPDSSVQFDVKSGSKELGKNLKKGLTNAQLVNTYLLGKSRMKKEMVEGKEVEVETNIARQRLIDQKYDVEAVDEYMKRPENADLMKYADWLEKYYNETARKAFEATYKEITEGGEFTIENYYPQTAEGKGLGQESDLFMDGDIIKDDFSFSDLLISKEMLRDSYVKERTNQGQLDVTKGADDIFRNYVKSMTRIKHFQEPAKNMGELVNDKNISELMEFQGGVNAMKGMKESFKMVVTGKTQNPGRAGNLVVGQLQGLTTLATLMVKTANLAKQFTSFTHFWKAGVKYGLAGENAFLAGVSPMLRNNMANPFGLVSFVPGSPRFGLAKNTTAKEDAAFLTEVLTSQFIKKRYRGGAGALEIDVARMIEEGNMFGTNLAAARKNASNTLLLFTRLGDMAGVLLGPGGGLSFSVNLYRKYRGDGMSVKEATQKAYEDFVIEAQSAQQTSDLYYRSKFQQSAESRYIGMFKTSQSLAAKKVLNAMELMRSGKDLSKTEKAQAVSDMIHFSLFASLGFTATATGTMWLLTGKTPFEMGGGDAESEEYYNEKFDQFYGEGKMDETLSEVRKRMVYETVADNFQATMQGYGIPGALMDAMFNGLRDREAFNNSPVIEMVYKLTNAAGVVPKAIVDFMEEGSREDKLMMKGRAEAITGEKVEQRPDSNLALKIFTEAADMLGAKDNVEELVKFFDLMTSEKATLEDMIFKFNGWEKNFMKNITKYQREDWIYEKVMGEPISDIRPESYKKKVREKFRKEGEEMIPKQKESPKERAFNPFAYATMSSEKRISRFKELYKENKQKIDDFYDKNKDMQFELQQIIGD